MEPEPSTGPANSRHLVKALWFELVLPIIPCPYSDPRLQRGAHYGPQDFWFWECQDLEEERWLVWTLP